MMAKRPARRTVMKAFGQWLDYTEWKLLVQAGQDDPPPGDDISDMARSVIRLEENWRELADLYVNGATDDQGERR